MKKDGKRNMRKMVEMKKIGCERKEEEIEIENERKQEIDEEREEMIEMKERRYEENEIDIDKQIVIRWMEKNEVEMKKVE